MPRIAALIVVACLPIAPFMRAAEPTASHEERLDAWRKSGDYAAAEEYCRQQLSRTALTNLERHTLTLELARFSLEHALQSLPPTAGPLWTTAQGTARTYADHYANNPRRAQLYLQSGLAYLAQGELLLSAADEPGEPPQLALREAIKLIRRARELVDAETRLAPRSARREVPVGAIPPWSLDELRSLDRHLRFELAQALQRQAEAYPLGSEDRMLAATQAAELFRGLGDLADTEPLAWPSRVYLAGCERLLSHWAAAERAIARCDVEQLPVAQRGRLRAEQLRLALARDEVDAALRLALEPIDERGERMLDGDLAVLDVQLAAVQRASARNAQQEAQHHTSEASRRVRAIGARWGAYWGEVAAARLARHLTSGDAAADHEAWALAGDALYQQGQVEQALAAYDQACRQAESVGSSNAALVLGMKGAAVEQSREHFTEAATRFRDAAIAHPEQSRAAEAHYAAIFNASRSGLDQGSQVTWLEEHLRLWPDATTSSQIRLLLANARAQQRDWRAAVELLAKIEAQDALASEAIRSAQNAYQSWLRELPVGGERQQVAAGALRHFAAYRQSTEHRQVANSVELLAAAAEAELLIRERASFEAAEQLLESVLQPPATSADPQRAVAEAWWLVARAAQPAKFAAAREEFARLPKVPVETLDALLSVLAELRDDSDAAPTQERAALRLELIERRRATLRVDDEQTVRHWALRYAVTLAEAGRPDEAIVQLRRLRQSSPEDGEIAAALGRLLVESKEAAGQEALACWRTVERAAQAGASDWFEAKYWLAELHYQAGDKAQAAKIIQITRTLHPDLGGAAWKTRFEELLANCQASAQYE